MKGILFSGAILLFLVAEIYCHSYLTTPTSRNDQRTKQGGCRGPLCTGPCEVPVGQAITPKVKVTRGQTLSIKWPRNNHAGGFVRFAWGVTANSDSHAAFDGTVQLYTCFEIGPKCKPDDPSLPNGGDSAGIDACGADIVVPGWATDGDWTLQWAWFGGAFTLGDYYGCVDYTVNGGPSSAQGTAVLFGGDYSNPTNNSVCKYFSTDQLHVCINEPCENAPYPGEHVGPVRGVGTTNIVGTGAAAGSTSPLDGGNVASDNTLIPCTNSTDCASGICEISGFCYVAGKHGGLTAGGIAALFFAFLLLIIVAVAVAFAFINKSEWPNWKPFKH